VFPTQPNDLASAGTREGQKTNGRDHARHLGSVPLRLGQGGAEPCQLVPQKKALHLALGVALDVPAWVRVIGPEAPALGEVEHLREQSEHPVGCTRRRAHPVMELRDVRTTDILNPQAPECG